MASPADLDLLPEAISPRCGPKSGKTTTSFPSSLAQLESLRLFKTSATSTTPDKIIACLVDIDWTTIDMVRIGTQVDTSDPIILWVGVAPGSLSWQQGVEIACCCRKVLLKAGLDIHCEIRESIVKRTASVILFHEGNDLSLRSLSAALGGQAIAGEKTPTKEGTLGLYLLVGGVKCALVSRHAVSDDNYSSLNG